MNIGVTGYLGFIGNNFVENYIDTLSRKYENVWLIDKHSNVSMSNKFMKYDDLYKNVHEVKATINNIDIFVKDDLDIIINFAAESHVTNSINSSEEFITSNVSHLRAMLDYCKSRKCKLFHISTDEVYGDDPPLDGHLETDCLEPSNPYAASKAAGDLLIKSYGRTHNLEYIIFRVTNNYGLHQHHEKLIPSVFSHFSVCDKSGDNPHFPLHDNGTPKRNWLHVDDTCRAILLLLPSFVTGKISKEIYNCNGNLELMNIETYSKLFSLWYDVDYQELIDGGIKQYCDFSYSRPGQDIRYFLNDSKLKKEIGWSPQKKFDQEIKSMIKRYKLGTFRG